MAGITAIVKIVKSFIDYVMLRFFGNPPQ